MKVTIEEIQYIAKLAKLKFQEEEAAVFAKEFDSILAHFENINKEDYTEIEKGQLEKPTSTLRKDEEKYFEEKEALFQNVKGMREGYIELPKIVE
ncbi:aspartyl/glutamyl-tRNA(Asn/Gln) amidotransferase subunit C [Natronincola peptidivorans]|uniref:Aspartyl/glutamyl-tRNA(Asn/Gln) amidotransferase subunit C n=1 Tax=Natronincola peptidivorans TaxID=426128 RepID=A0A1I0BX41_9FIRM|nr:Asp-tRNA(Asn)/Glu-tRNA(Gln) amidotransferase subunit GatC [Natronincola peptidivorans]SET10952.1 aspartyl/glutamyl-tRNA(Asn/Gln) amidotransferase subunit C [Natronincola peptidivorans]